MEDEDAKQIIESLLTSLEDSVVLGFAQRAVILSNGGKQWDSDIIAAKEIFEKKMRPTFGKLREILLPRSPGIPLQADWRQIVQRLIESANDPDLPGLPE